MYKTKTRMWSLIMSILLLLGCIPDMGLYAMAADDETTDAELTANDDAAGLADDLLTELGLGDIIEDEYEDDNDPATYKVWIGDVQITESNKDNVLGDGKVSFDPESHTLTLKNAVIDKITTKDSKAPTVSANICACEDLIIKGSAKLTNGYTGLSLRPEDFNRIPSFTIDADLDIEAVNIGISASFAPLCINGGNITIKSGFVGIVASFGDLTLTGGNYVLTGTRIGIMGSSSLIISGAAIEAESSEGAVMANPAPNSTIEIYSPSFIEEPSGTKIAPVKIEGRNGQAVVDSNGNPVKKIKIGLNSVTEKVTVTFNQNGHGLTAIPPRVIGKGDKVCAPPPPVDNKIKFGDWYIESACKNKYDFDTPVNNDLTLYAQWLDENGNPVKPEEPAPWPDPIYSSGSALDPVPSLLPGTTTDLYLVKGQKFNIGEGWTVDKEGKKVISISKKGVFNAKKEGKAVITGGKGDDTCSVTIHVSAPKLETKSLKLEIDKADAIVSDQIVLNYDHENLDKVLWHSASPDVAIVDQNGKVTAVSKGTAKVSAYINGKAYTCTVSVKEKVSAEKRTIHIANVKGASKTISIKDLKKPVWSASDEGIVTIKNNKKIIPANPGHTVLTASGNELTYSVDVYVEDIALTDDSGFMTAAKGKNKYDLKMAVGEDTFVNLNESVEQDVIFKTSKPDVAFIDEYGSVRARSKGTCKFTAKIDGKTITINVTVSEAK